MWIDVSNYSEIPDSLRLDALLLAGVTGVIVGTQSIGKADAQLAAFRARGFACETYLYPVYDAGDPGRVAAAIELSKRHGVTRIWDDIEWVEAVHGPRPSAAIVVNGIDIRWRTIRGAGLDVGVYTSESQWPLMTGGRLDGVIQQIDSPLWSAYYYNDRRVPVKANFRPYGPWTAPLLWQYSERGLDGYNCDLNIRYADTPVISVTAPRPETPAPGLSDEEAEELAERRAKALLDISLLYGYRCVPRPGNKVELLNNDETPLDPRIIIPLRVPRVN